jgi:hypothetical protein
MMEYDVSSLRFTERKRKGQKGQNEEAYGSFFTPVLSEES